MGLGLIPIYMSIVVIALCGLAALVGGMMLISRESRDAGRVVLRVSGVALLTGLVFTWAGLFVCGILWHTVGERAAVIALWASGPVGILFAVVWHCLHLPIARSKQPKENV
jgi:uncharacterized membrane protein YagU involved in acid resistance